MYSMNSYRRRLVSVRNTKLISALLIGLEFCQLYRATMGIMILFLQKNVSYVRCK